MLIGAYAVNYHGYFRSTNDLDIWVKMSEENSQKVKQSLIDFGFYEKSIKDFSFSEPNQVFRMGVPPLRIEIITTISGVEYEGSIKNCIMEVIDEIELKIISLEDIRINKKASGRLKDLNDLENLE